MLNSALLPEENTESHPLWQLSLFIFMPVEENILWEAIVFGPGQVYVGCIRVIIITLNLTKYSVNFEVLMLKKEVEGFYSMGSLKLKMAD